MNKDWKITQIFNLNSNKDLHDVTHSRIDLERKKKNKRENENKLVG